MKILVFVVLVFVLAVGPVFAFQYQFPGLDARFTLTVSDGTFSETAGFNLTGIGDVAGTPYVGAPGRIHIAVMGWSKPEFASITVPCDMTYNGYGVGFLVWCEEGYAGPRSAIWTMSGSINRLLWKYGYGGQPYQNYTPIANGSGTIDLTGADMIWLNNSLAPVPEPSSLLVLVGGLIPLGPLIRRRR
jgi:hypothetical protein